MLTWPLPLLCFSHPVSDFKVTMLLMLLLTTFVSGHSWVEQMQVIGSNGSYIGDYGYPRGYVERNPSLEYGFANKWQLPIPDASSEGRIHINASDFACHTAQRTANYSSEFPMLNVLPGSWVALKYLENGHVTQPWIPAGKPEAGGTVWVYGTTQPSDSEKLVDVLQWTQDGKGGNGKGWLMTTNNFDDGRCHQLSSYAISVDRQMKFPNRVPGQPTSQLEQLCETNLHIPESAKAGSKITAYWIWSWQTSTKTEGAPCGKDEYYTTCADLNIVDGDEQKLIQAPKVHTIGQQDPQLTAVGTYKSRTAIASKPNLITTQTCKITQITSSSIPASVSMETTLPTTTVVSTAVPTTSGYAATPPPVNPSPPASPSTLATSSAPTSAPTPTTPPTIAAPSSSIQSTPTPSTTSADTYSPPSSAAVSNTGSQPSITFSTKTIHGTGPRSVTAPGTAPTAPAATPVVSTDGVVRVAEKRGIPHMRAIRHGRRRI